ncbi:hypothetical protein M2347_000529 [Chryseobacterium sp. H1D6B]|uniref:hypothetical protein n=1 Tax=Chryseobacterium sp. H1D6B TaxID=2940588 RepID=UPI0015CD821A|nr:hypothetical protein [Chryseobacterium sp. H1D6B]MDH6250802.1 hypothetical protein [Chryseobacterium sp. H1D6B]
MTTLNRDEYAEAVAGWGRCLSDYSTIENMIPPNYVFTLSPDQITWVKGNNKYKEFCVDMGVFKDQVIIILSPLDGKGQKIAVDNFPYSVLAEMGQDLTLFEKQDYTLVKSAVLSKDLRKVDNDANMTFPIMDNPVMEQDKAIDAIEEWRNEGQNWLYLECNEPYNGSRIFQRFYVPVLDLTLPEGLNWITCSFALKFSNVYQRMLVSMIFISFYQNLGNEVSSPQYLSNTYDWSQPCPPICRI